MKAPFANLFVFVKCYFYKIKQTVQFFFIFFVIVFKATAQICNIP